MRREATIVDRMRPSDSTPAHPTSLGPAAVGRGAFVRRVRVGFIALVVVFLAGFAISQVPHTTWSRGSIHAVEQDLVGAIWPLAQSLDSSRGYGYTGDNPYPHLIQGDYGGTAFYPPAYPVLLWATNAVVGNPERASQVISGVAAILFLLATYFLAFAWTAKRGLALLATAIAASAAVFLTLSYAAGTDLLAAAASTAALAFGLWGLRSERRRRWIILAAVSLGVAFLIRRQAAVLLVPLAVIAFVSARERRREGALRVAMTALAFGLVALPDLLIQFSLHGSPFYGAHGKNIWNAVVNQFDWPNYHSVPNTISAVGVLLSAPMSAARNWTGNMLYYFELPWVGPATLLAIPGAWLLWKRPSPRRATIAAVGAAVFVAIVASVSERGDRHAFLLVPTLAVVAAAGVWYGLSGRRRLLAAALVVAVAAPVGVAHTANTIASELQVPSLEEAVAAIQADGATPSDVMTNFGSAHYAFYSGIGFVPLSGDVYTWDDLRSFMDQHHVKYFVARGLGLHVKRLTEALEPAAAPAWLTPIFVSPTERNDFRIVVYRYDALGD